MSFKVNRVEDDESSRSNQIVITWTIQRFRNVYNKARTKQRIKSPAFHVPNVAAFDIDGTVVLFPKGLGRSGDVLDEPLLGIELRHAPRDPDPEAAPHTTKPTKKRIVTPIRFEVEAFTETNEDDIPDMLGQSLGAAVDMEIMKKTCHPAWQRIDGEHSVASSSAGSGDSSDTIEVPNAVSVESVERIQSSLSLVIKITFLSHADDISDVSDDFGLRQDEQTSGPLHSNSDDNLFSNVLTRGQDMWKMLHDASTPQDVGGDEGTVGRESRLSAAAAASAMVAEATADLFHRHPTDSEYSPEWLPLVELYCSEEVAPNAWQCLPPGCWNILVHCLVDLDHLLLKPSAPWSEATANWSRPAPSAVSTVTEWCPPLRLRLVELVPQHTSFKDFWVGFFCALDACARIDPLHQTCELEEALLGGAEGARVAPTSVRAVVHQCLQLVSFVLLSHAPDVIPISLLSRTDVEAQLDGVRDACRSLSRKFQGSSADNSVAERTAAHLTQMVAAWRREEAATLKEHASLVERARTICEHGSWSLAARRTLASAGDRSALSVTEITDLLAMALDAATALSNAPVVV